jgi:hypothetical protein
VLATSVKDFLLRREKLVLLAGVVLAIFERGAWALLRSGSGAQGEARHIAVALATGRGYADAFRVGQGPTDHLAPTTPAFGGLVYWLLGVNTPAAELTLWVVATSLAILSYLLFYRAFSRVGIPQPIRILIFLLLCVAPTYIAQESSDFRLWDGALAAFLAAVFLDRLLALDRARVRTLDVLGMSLLAGFTFWAKPPVGLGVFAAAGLFCIVNLRGARLATALLSAPLAIALFAVPWGLRNQTEMGRFLPLRDNAGLELALAQYDGALAPVDGAKRRMARFQQIHPSGSAFDKLAALGESEYSEQLGRETKAWMLGHPISVMQIAAMHFGQIAMPPAWLFRLWGMGALASLRALLASLVDTSGLIGIGIGITMLRRREWGYVALLVIIPMLPYLLFQPLPRYLYLFYAPLAFASGGILICLGQFAPDAPRKRAGVVPS